MSEGPKVKPTRARCILVAAIVVMMWVGLTNNYEVEKDEKSEVSLR